MNNEKISNENIYVADKRDEDAQKRLFRMRFTFKNKKYEKKNFVLDKCCTQNYNIAHKNDDKKK